jgi:hypothetical protein
MDIFEDISATLAVTSFDPNDSRATAAQVDAGQYDIQGNGEDWYRFDAPAGNMAFAITATEAPLNLSLELYNAADNPVFARPSPTATESFEFFNTADQTYFLRVATAQFAGTTPPPDLVMTYTMTIDLADDSVSDGNDTRATAQTLTEGRHVISGSAVDWFRLQSTAGQISVTLDTATDAIPQNLNAVLYNAAGQVVGANNNPTGDESFTATVPSDGDYFLKLFWAGAADTTSSGIKLNYTLDIDLPDVVVSDGNDTFATAAPLTEGRHVVSGTAVDWYRVESLSGRIDVALTTAAGAQRENLNVVLYAADGTTVLGSNTNPTGNESFSTIVPTDGSYYLKVFWAGAPDTTSSGIQLEYTLDLTLPDLTVPGPNDPGRTLGTAAIIPANGTHSFVGTGLDWFRIDTGPGRFTINMTDTGDGVANAVEEVNMNLYDSSGTLLQANRVEGGTETVSFLSQLGGTYYIQMFSPRYEAGTPNGLTLNYDLEVDIPRNTWARALDFGPVRNSSVAAFDIDNDGKDEIFVGTNKTLDAQGNEIRPGGLIVLEDDGTVKWTQTFAATLGVDRLTGKTYNTTSVTTQPVFSDLNGDGTMEILVGVGAGVSEEFKTPGQPGDMGGLYALDANGNILWFFQTKDVFGSALDQPNDGPDGRTEGVYGTPRVFDIDADGKREVIFTSWDHRLYVLDAKTGLAESEFDLHDTASTTPNIADVDGDGLYEIVVASDITSNPRAGIATQGGILQVLTNYAQPIVQGWTDNISGAVGASADFRGKFVEQALWSSPKIADLDRDGSPEIIHGTSNFFTDGRGQFIKIWNADGTERATLNTIGETRAAPLLADLDGNGTLEIIATTVAGYVYGWNADGTELFSTRVAPFIDPELGIITTEAQPSIRQAIAVDLDNADNDLEILVSIGSQTIILDSDGTQITSTTRENSNNIFQVYAGSPLAKDIDGDGKLDLISGGTTANADQAIIYRWENPLDAGPGAYRTAEYQSSQSLHEIQNFVERFYATILGRTADPYGGNFWTDALHTGVRSGADVATGFIGSKEFQDRNTTDAQYVNTLYAAFFGRPADAGGFNAWITKLDGGMERDQVLLGFTGSQEFTNLTNRFGIRAENSFGASNDAALILGDANDSNVLRGGAGSNVLNDKGGDITAPGNRANIDNSGAVFRLYGATLGRGPDTGGFTAWLNGLNAGTLQLEQVSGAFVNSPEFQRTYGALGDAAFINLLYQNVLGRDADAGGLAGWQTALDNGRSRAQVVLGFSQSVEYQNNTTPGLDNFMTNSRIEWRDVLEGRGGNDVMNGGIGSDIFIFRATETGNDVIHGFEPWDQLQLSGFGYNSKADAIARMSQQGANVVFSHAGQTINFTNTMLKDMNRVTFNI